MHCDRCNIDFPEGLRYCKWCGEPLIDRPRVTSELHSCPSCSAPVQPGWAFCKSCGERLHAAAGQPAAAACPQCGALNETDATNCVSCGADLTGTRTEREARDLTDTTFITTCQSCGEIMDTGSLYCKACGSAAYAQQKPFGGSALLCGACKSYSPLGSKVCRVCGIPLGEAPKTMVDRAAQQKPSTLRDLDDHLPEMQPEAQEHSDVTSGANTIIFASDEQSASLRESFQTNLLPGTAGAKSEQQSPTAMMQMGRSTGPVEDEPLEGEASQPQSGDLQKTPAADISTEPSRTVEFTAPDVSGFVSETPSKQEGLRSETEVFVSPQLQGRDQSQQVSQDEAVDPDAQVTREISEFRRGMTGDHLRNSAQRANAAETSIGATFEPSAGGGLPSQESLRQVASQPLPKKRSGVVIASLIVSFIVVGAAVYIAWWLVFSRGRTTPPPSTVSVPNPPPTVPVAPPLEASVPVAPEGMVMVAAGAYTIGRDGADPLEQPQHKIDLPAFFIDRTEVTNAAYKKFVDATNHKPPSNWSDGNFAEGRGDFPVTGVTWQDAADYAAWAGKRLPSEVEWEAAARGNDGRIYPWGNNWRSGLANIGTKQEENNSDQANQYPSGLKEAGRYADGASPVGAVDMIGNAWEWTADEFALYPGGISVIPKVIKDRMIPGLTYRVIRGGAYDGNKKHDATYRGLLDAAEAYPKVGFRCAKDAK